MSTVAVIIGSEIRERGKWSLSRSDRASVHIALNCQATSVVAFSIEPDDNAERYARASGISTFELLEPDRPFEFGLTIVGQGVTTRFGDIIPARIAASQDAALLFDVLDTQPIAGSDLIRVIRDAGKGAREVLSVVLPAVLVVAEDVPKPAYVSRYRLSNVEVPDRTGASARAESIEMPSWEPMRPRVRTHIRSTTDADSSTDRMTHAFGNISSVSSPNASESLIEADAATCAQHLLRYLRHHGFVTSDKDAERVNIPTTVVQKPIDVPLRPHVEPELVRSRWPIPVGGDGTTRGNRRPKRLEELSLVLTASDRSPRPLDSENRPVKNLTSNRCRRPTKFVESDPQNPSSKK